MKARITVTFEYEMTPEHYEGCADGAAMVAIDVQNIKDDPATLGEMVAEGDFTISGEAVE